MVASDSKKASCVLDVPQLAAFIENVKNDGTKKKRRRRRHDLLGHKTDGGEMHGVTAVISRWQVPVISYCATDAVHDSALRRRPDSSASLASGSGWITD